jgi:NADH:ubiquinone reductase (H+-translocating)
MTSHGTSAEQSEPATLPDVALLDTGEGTLSDEEISSSPESMATAMRGNDAARSVKHRVVIVGGGFGGLAVARGLSNVRGIDVTLLDRRNFHLFQPLLYQVATGALSPGDVAAPLRETLRRSKNVTVLLGDVMDIDPASHCVVLHQPTGSTDFPGDTPGDLQVPYDTLVVAAGMVNNYFGRSEWAALAPGLKSVEDATELRSRILLAFEQAERTTDPVARRALLTFVVVGGGATGVEMAGAITEFAADTLPVEFRRISMEHIRVVLLDGGTRVLAGFPEKLSAAALRDLTNMGVEVQLSTMVKQVDAGGVVIEHAAPPGAEAARDRIDARVVIWAAGVRGTSLAASLAQKTGAPLTRQGTIEVAPDLSLPGHPEILVVGDAASFAHGLERPLPGVAQVAIQQGKYAAKLVAARARGEALEPFRYDDRGSMATIGRAKAVADLGWTQLTGFVAWLAWLFVHLLFLVGYENRILVLTQWAWYYVWRRRSARLITAWEAGETTPTGL